MKIVLLVAQRYDTKWCFSSVTREGDFLLFKDEYYMYNLNKFV